jgi:glycosyltransferase involved in cell wall biosynthesis
MSTATPPPGSLNRPPRVSIGLPVYNGERYLRQAVESLLAQTFTDFELILLDNASTDGTQSICRDLAAGDPRVVYLREPVNTGGIRNHNKTVELARGEYFKWAAHDDNYAPTFVERCVQHLDAAPNTVLAFSRAAFIDENGAPLHEYHHPLDLARPDPGERFLAYVFANHVMVEDYGLMRTGVLRSTPLFGTFVWSDMVLFAELAFHGPFIEIPEVLFFRRDHPQRAMRANKDARSLGAWSAPRGAGGSTCPTWRVLRANLETLRRLRMPMAMRLRLAVGVLRRAYWTGNLAHELLAAAAATARPR